MRYDLATNFDQKLLDDVIRMDTGHQIKSMYGKLKTDAIGGGRSAFLLHDVSLEQLRTYANSCRGAGIAFNYLLNPMCLGSSDFDPEEHSRMLLLLDQLYELGVREYTVNAPFLLQLMKKRYGDVRVTIGLYAYISTLQQIQYWMNMGADALTLDHQFNRNFSLLRAALRWCKGTGVELRLIANNLCLHDCPLKISHGCSTSHLSKATTLIPFDYNLLSCALMKTRDMSSILSAGFIRPEDVRIYRQLAADVGNENFSLKLVERTRSSAFILNVVRAYLAESHDGNLLDIVNWLRRKHLATVPGPPNATLKKNGPPGLDVTEHYDTAALMRYAKAIDFPDIHVDNKRLDGFIDHFLKHYNCNRLLCRGTVSGRDATEQATCNYCGEWAEKVISFDETAVQKWIADATQAKASLDESTMFRKAPQPSASLDCPSGGRRSSPRNETHRPEHAPTSSKLFDER